MLLNNTSRHNHHGCRRVVATIRHCLGQRRLDILDTAPVGSPWSSNQQFLRSIEAADLILINGEGTLHHGTDAGRRLLEVVDHRQRRDKPVVLVNTIYQENPPQWVDWLGKISLIATRDRSSPSTIQRLGIDCDYVPDLSLYFGASDQARVRGGDCIGYGDSVFPKVQRALWQAYRREHRPRLYLPTHTGILHPARPSGLSMRRRLRNARFKMQATFRNLRDSGHRVSDDVEGFLRSLRQTSIYLTGRYHGACLAIAGGVPFRAAASNSYKIEALLEESGSGGSVWCVTSRKSRAPARTTGSSHPRNRPVSCASSGMAGDRRTRCSIGSPDALAATALSHRSRPASAR